MGAIDDVLIFRIALHVPDGFYFASLIPKVRVRLMSIWHRYKSIGFMDTARVACDVIEFKSALPVIAKTGVNRWNKRTPQQYGQDLFKSYDGFMCEFVREFLNASRSYGIDRIEYVSLADLLMDERDHIREFAKLMLASEENLNINVQTG